MNNHYLSTGRLGILIREANESGGCFDSDPSLRLTETQEDVLIGWLSNYERMVQELIRLTEGD